MIEVFISIAASELEKATVEAKVALVKEIMELTNSYSFLEKESSKRNKIAQRKGPSNDVLNKRNTESKENSHVSYHRLNQTGGHFFTTSSLHELLVSAINLYSDCYSNEPTASQNHSQSSCGKKMEQCLILISFALRACLHHLKSVATMRSGLSDDSFKTFFYGDVKKLGRPIMQLVWLLKSLPKLEKDSKKKEAKGKRNVESKGTQLFLALLCLKELFMVSLSKGQITEVIEDLLTLSTSELGEEDTLNAAEGINRQEQLIVDDQDLRNLHLFLDNKMKPLYCQLLMLSLPRESEVTLILSFV